MCLCACTDVRVCVCVCVCVCVDIIAGYHFMLTLWWPNDITGNVRYGALDTLTDANEIAFQKILEGSEDGGVEAVSKLKALYRSCMDLTSISKLGSAPLVQLISDVGMSVHWNGEEGELQGRVL